MKFISIIRTEKIMKSLAFCGNYNIEYTLCLKNAVNVLVA
jgi:hypothetical protein